MSCILLEGGKAPWDLGRMQLYVKVGLFTTVRRRTVKANEKVLFLALFLWAGPHLSVPGQVGQSGLN